MKKFDYNQAVWQTQISARDMFDFMSMITEDSRFNGDEFIFIRHIEEVKPEPNPTMIRLRIEFLRERKIGEPDSTQKHWAWECYRAKDWSCSNMNFRPLR